jgi:AcrR family transcriptional regulator
LKLNKSNSQTKEKILQSARSLYSIHGSKGTTLDDILTAAGITKGAFYHYFKSKETLCTEVIEEVIVEYHELFESIDRNSEPIQQLSELISKLSQLNTSGQWINCRVILRVSAEIIHEHRPHLRQKIKNFWRWESAVYKDIITECQKAGQISSDIDAGSLSQILINMITGSLWLEKINPEQQDFSELIESLIKTLEPGGQKAI